MSGGFRFFDYDNDTGIREDFSVVDGKAVIRQTQDESIILEDNKADLNNSSSTWKGDMHHVARIPLIIVEQWRNELKASGAHDTNPLSNNNKKFLISKINNSDFSTLRTKAGRI